MDEIDQECIICTLTLGAISPSDSPDVMGEAVAGSTEIPVHSYPCKNNDLKAVAVIKPCNHFLHNHCLREWSQISNTCPLCRQTFNLVEVLDTLGGTLISSYTVKDKKQEAVFDPSWVQEANEDDDGEPCPICNESSHPEILVLCDACDTNYHTYCAGLEDVPLGDWFCMECAELGAAFLRVDEESENLTLSEQMSMHRIPRTQATIRRTRQRQRNDGWLGPWSQIGQRIHGATGLDIDFSEDEDVTLWRRINQNSTHDETQRNVWRLRLNIARRQGADWASPRYSPRAPTPVESIEESMAWGDFEKAKEIDITSPRAKKRKSRLAVATSSAIPTTNAAEAQPQRKLKRPRTRRVLDRPESSSSSVLQSSVPQANKSIQNVHHPNPIRIASTDEPSFLSSLLREVNTASGLEDARCILPSTSNKTLRTPSSPVDLSSPLMSPASSSHSNSGVVSKASPSQIKCRSISPLPLTSRIEPRFSPAEYSPTRQQKVAHEEISNIYTEPEANKCRSFNKNTLPSQNFPSTMSLARATLSCETKRDISRIVKSALAPHWRSAEITKEQYGCINRDVSRKLYEILAENDLDERGKHRCKKIATAQVALAIKSLSSR